MSVTLVTGGARSGKSRFAEHLAHGEKHYIATAQTLDDEMRQRVLKHQAQRGPGWMTHEEPIELPKKLSALDGSGTFILIDCLTLWLTNLILAGHDEKAAGEKLVAVLSRCMSDVVLVSNEVGSGIVPDNALSRKFRDAQGVLNQNVAAVAGRVVLMAAGLPLALKGPLPTVPPVR